MTKRRTAIGIVAASSLLLSAGAAVAAPAPVVPNRAAQWLVAQQADTGAFTNSFGGDSTADAVLGLVAGTTDDLTVPLDKAIAHLKAATKSPVKVTDAAKLAVIADAMDTDATTLFAVDAAEVLTSALTEDGSIETSTGSFGDAWILLGLQRSGETVPAAACEQLADQQDASGAFGYVYEEKFTADIDTTGAALMGLSTCDTSDADAATTKAVAWLEGQQQEDGSWPNAYSPVNTTALAAMGLKAAGKAVDDAADWLADQQNADGGLAYGGASDLLATAQALPILAGQTYADVTYGVAPIFSDVTDALEHADHIEWLALQGISTGYADGTYKPLDAVNRDAMAAFLYRYAGSPEVKLPEASPFVDLKPSDQFYTEIVWLSQQGITEGWDVPDGKAFKPVDAVNRDAMAAFLYRAAGKPAWTAPATSPFTDLKPSDQFYAEITWLANQKVTTGWADGTFKPVDAVKRDAMAAFLHRFDAVVPVK